MKGLVLSAFPGIDIFGRAFEDEGYCVVKTGDPIFGQRGADNFHPPAGAFEGIIGGPPCKAHTRARFMSQAYRKNHAIDLVPMFLRIVSEARPSWWLMENTPDVPDVAVDGYQVHRFTYDSRWLGKEQHRLRKFQFGTRGNETFTSAELTLSEAVFESGTWERTILAVEGRKGRRSRGIRGDYMARRSLARICELQGIEVPQHLATTTAGTYELVGNAVHYDVARELARAVRAATTDPET